MNDVPVVRYPEIGKWVLAFSRKFLFASLLLFGVCNCSQGPVRAVIVVNAKSGEVIYERNADQKSQPASLAKMMTLLLAFKALDEKKTSLRSKIFVSREASGQQPCILGLKEGDKITVRDSILAMVTKSANDASVALAEHISGGSVEKFVDMMNREAKRIGMNSTVFINPSGWKNCRQLTTARDMSKLARALYREHPKYYRFFSTKTFYYDGKRFDNHNTLLGERKNLIFDGIKTGFVNASGFNLATSASRKKDRLILVFFGGRSARERDKESELILRRCFANISTRKNLFRPRLNHSRLREEMLRLSRS